MAFLEETQLLRTLTFALTTLSCTYLFVPQSVAQETENGVVEFAPGSTGRITAPLATIVDNGKRQGEELRQTLKPQDEAENAFSSIDFEQIRTRALTDPRVKALLGAGDHGSTSSDDEEIRYDGATIFMLASFSMPKSSLRQMMSEAQKFGVPIVFRGFVNNSVYETENALVETFGTLDDSVGFNIDPTIFTRFQITSVPQVIAVDQAIDVCETPGCEADPVPPHDRVGGNVPIEFALQLIADSGDVGAFEARRLLDSAEASYAD